VRFGPGGREGWRGAHQGVADGGGATEFSRVGHTRLGSRARAEDRVPASVRRGKEGPWARHPRAGGAGGEEGREEAEEVLTDDEELRAASNGTAARFAGDGACGGEERVWEQGRVKGQSQGSLGRLYRARRGEEGRRPKKEWPSMPWGAGLESIQRGRGLNGEETVGD
jgi:hypothetical protein